MDGVWNEVCIENRKRPFLFFFFLMVRISMHINNLLLGYSSQLSKRTLLLAINLP